MRRFLIKRGDLNPPLRVQFFKADMTARDMTGLAGVNFMMGKPGATPIISVGPVTSVSLVEGILEYRWVAGDTDDPGEYRAEFIITTLDGKEETYPKDGYIVVEVVQDVRAP